MSALPPKVDIAEHNGNVRFVRRVQPVDATPFPLIWSIGTIEAAPKACRGITPVLDP
jgi:hypothetical protein